MLTRTSKVFPPPPCGMKHLMQKEPRPIGSSYPTYWKQTRSSGRGKKSRPKDASAHMSARHRAFGPAIYPPEPHVSGGREHNVKLYNCAVGLCGTIRILNTKPKNPRPA